MAEITTVCAIIGVQFNAQNMNQPCLDLAGNPGNTFLFFLD